MIGRTIGKYRVVGKLGQGSGGAVYKALDETLHREVAIKILNSHRAKPETMKRFRSEATTLAKLNHPGIATIYEFVEWNADLLIAMELVRGETLEKLSRRSGPMLPDRAAYLIDRVLSALDYAHSAGVVHRDMKPSNIMVTTSGDVKIMDFGIARVRDTQHTTVEGSLMGTPAFMAPEQVLGKDVDGRSDLYAVGVIFYRVLTGALPFNADSALAVLHKHVSEEPIPVRALNNALPEWCHTITARALAKSPADRFQTAEEFRQAVGRAAGMLPPIDFAKEFAAAEIAVVEQGSESSSTDTASMTPLQVAEAARKTFARAAIMRAAVLLLMLGVVTGGAAFFSNITGSSAATPPTLTTKNFQTVVFQGKVLSGQREQDAQFLLADGVITVSAAGTATHRLRSVPFDNVVSISYSRGIDPMWTSPAGRHVAARQRGALGLFPRQRNWVTLQTNLDDRLITLWFSDGIVDAVLAALEERTGLSRNKPAG
jgi:serine/threonine protein kinase